MPFLSLFGSRLEHPTDIPLDADRLAATAGLSLARAAIVGHAEGGAVRLIGAHIGGQLNCTGAILRNDAGPALHADGLQVDHDMFLNHGYMDGTGDRGAIRLAGAHIGGQLDCSRATMFNLTGPALHADGLRVDQGMFLRNEFNATGINDLGAVRLAGAHIGGQLDCAGATMLNDAGPALRADNLQVGRSMFLNDQFTATGTGEDGAVRLPGARIGGQLDCSGAILRTDAGPALHADNLQVGQSMFLTDQFTATGGGDRGTVRLPGARIGSNLECTEATLVNKTGPALLADRLQVDQNLLLTAWFTATCDGALGAVRLLSARIGGQLTCAGASSDTGPALVADDLQVDQVMRLRGEFTGSGTLGAVRLVGAHIGGQLECTGATVVNDTGTALNADNLQVDQDVYLGGGFGATGGGGGVAVDLTSARLGGRLVFDPVPRLEHATDPRARLAVNGLAYRDVPAGISAREWLGLLREGTRRYAAQPYQQLAAVHRADGHDGDVRRVLMSQRRDQLADPSTSRLERAWGRLTRLTLGYGYQPWRALLFLLAVVGIAVTLTITVGPHGGLGRIVHPPVTTATGCSTVERIGVGLDFSLPLINTGARDLCDTTDSATGQALTVAAWVLQLLAWAFAALFIAGFTSAVRNT
jgi:hypothetical protein